MYLEAFRSSGSFILPIVLLLSVECLPARVNPSMSMPMVVVVMEGLLGEEIALLQGLLPRFCSLCLKTRWDFPFNAVSSLRESLVRSNGWVSPSVPAFGAGEFPMGSGLLVGVGVGVSSKIMGEKGFFDWTVLPSSVLMQGDL